MKVMVVQYIIYNLYFIKIILTSSCYSPGFVKAIGWAAGPCSWKQNPVTVLFLKAQTPGVNIGNGWVSLSVRQKRAVYQDHMAYRYM